MTFSPIAIAGLLIIGCPSLTVIRDWGTPDAEVSPAIASVPEASDPIDQKEFQASERSWNHGWESSSAMTFADFLPSRIFSKEQAEFAASKYRVLSLEKCSGSADGVKTEEAIYTMAQQIKEIDPTIKVFFYWATDQEGIRCYDAADAFKANPSWWLRDDDGTIITMKRGNHYLDVTHPVAREWWMSIPLKGDGNGTFNGVSVADLIDGVLADNAHCELYNAGHINTTRLEALEDAKYAMISELQERFAKANGGIVMANGINMYGGRNADPRHPNLDNLWVLNFTGGIMNEHSAVFESVNAKNASLNVHTVSRDLQAIEDAAMAANGSKVVFMQTWPGLYCKTKFHPSADEPAEVYPPVTNGGEPTPQTTEEWQSALRNHFQFAHALFLSVAASNVYWMYGGVWYGPDGYLDCPEDPTSCPAPPEWYPDLEKKLGAPLGPRKMVSPYVWTRRFEHASVLLDLNRPNASSVTFDSDEIVTAQY